MTEAETRRFAEAMTVKIRRCWPDALPTLEDVILQVVIDTELLLDSDNSLSVESWESPPEPSRPDPGISERQTNWRGKRDRPNPGLTFASNPWPDRLIAGAYVLVVVVLGIMAAMWLATL